MQIHPELIAETGQFVAIRRAIHAAPELAFVENSTADLICARLADWQIPFERGVGGTGVVASLQRGNSNRSLGLRADMDALPIGELNDFAHRSIYANVMHACGHDGHTAMLLAAAYHLSRHGDFEGTVHFVFQPGEESGLGARAMVDDGLFERFPMDAIFGAHNWPNLPVGSFAVAPGPMMASCNEFRITVSGNGGHAAMPHQTVDPVQPACAIGTALQTIVSRNLTPGTAAVLSVTMIAAGDTVHVIPDSVAIKGTVRTFSTEVTDIMESRLRRITENIAAGYGATCSVEFIRDCAPTVNSEAEACFVRDTLKNWVGDTNVIHFTPSMTAEDFSFMLEAKAGCYFLIGNGDGNHRLAGHGMGPCVLHNASYDFNDALIPVGAQAWVLLTERWLSSNR